VNEVITIIRKKLHLGRDDGIILLANGRHLMKTNSSLMEIFDKHKDEDGFLYVTYAPENLYG
jgi:microtubule-associated protein 1 light chain